MSYDFFLWTSIGKKVLRQVPMNKLPLIARSLTRSLGRGWTELEFAFDLRMTINTRRPLA